MSKCSYAYDFLPISSLVVLPICHMYIAYYQFLLVLYNIYFIASVTGVAVYA